MLVAQQIVNFQNFKIENICLGAHLVDVPLDPSWIVLPKRLGVAASETSESLLLCKNKRS